MCNRVQHLQNLRNIFLKSVESVRPHNLLSAENNYSLEPKILHGKTCIQLQGKVVDITSKHCHAVGFGKAVLGMAVQLEKALGSSLHSGVLSIPLGSQQQFQEVNHMCLRKDTVFKVYEGAENNQPDEVAHQAAKEIKHLATTLGKDDILFVLISGGGSALLPLPKQPLQLSDKMQLIRQLSNKGASIQEMNQVRIALSAIKGGQLALAAAQAAAVISFVISDIVGDPVDLIASGPTWPTTAKHSTAEEILRNYQLWEDLDETIKIVVQQGGQHNVEPLNNNNSIYVVGDNRVATSAAVAEAMSCNYNPFIASTTIQGDVAALATSYCEFLKAIYDFQDGLIEEHELSKQFPYDSRIFQHFLKTLLMCQKTKKPLLLITAGEPTVKVTGSGLGGRNQELALRIALKLSSQTRLHNVCFLSAGTDGIDGPTTAAGALACTEVIKDFMSENSKNLKDLQTFIDNNDSFNFFKQLTQGRYHVITGHTGTNVMDLHLLLVL